MFTDSSIKAFLETCNQKIKAFAIQQKQICFSAKFLKKGKVADSIDNGDIKNFNKLIRSSVKTENPDEMTIYLYNKDDKTLLWKKNIKEKAESDAYETVVASPIETQPSLGAINEIVAKEIQKYQEQKDREALELRLKRAIKKIKQQETEIEGKNKEIERLEAELEDIEDTISADNRAKGYIAVAAEAFPALNGMIKKSNLAGLLGIPTETETEQLPERIDTQDTQEAEPETTEGIRVKMVDGLKAYFYDDQNPTKYLHQLYTLFHKVTEAPEMLNTLLELIEGENNQE